MAKRQPTYGDEFRRDAVNLLIQSGRSLKAVAHELGMAANTLRSWRDQALGKGGLAKSSAAQPQARSQAPLTVAAEQLRRLQKENEYLRRQRDILKKAMGILSEDPRSVLP